MSVDLAIRNGVVIDGTGAEARAADVGIRDGRIVAVGAVPEAAHRDRRHRQGRHARLHRHPQPLRLHAARRPARGERRAPGRHARGRRQLRLRLLPAPQQGARAEGDLRALRRRPAHLDVGRRATSSGSRRRRRRSTCSASRRTARSGCRWSASRTGRRGRTSCTKMRYLLDEALEQGAWGYSTGLEYAAERGADEDELVSMCEVCGRRHGIYATHTRLRDEGADVRGRGGAAHGRALRREAAGLPPRPAQRARIGAPLHRARRRCGGRRDGHRLRHAHAALRDDVPAHGPAAVGARGSVAAARGPREHRSSGARCATT